MTQAVERAYDAGQDNPSTPDADAPMKTTRLSVNLALDVAQILRGLTVKRGITVTEGIRRAITLWKVIQDELDKGHTVQFVDQKGKVRELLLVP